MKVLPYKNYNNDFLWFGNTNDSTSQTSTSMACCQAVFKTTLTEIIFIGMYLHTIKDKLNILHGTVRRTCSTFPRLRI